MRSLLCHVSEVWRRVLRISLMLPGAPGEALSAMQHRKLKEINAKAKGEPRVLKRGRGFQRKAPPKG